VRYTTKTVLLLTVISTALFLFCLQKGTFHNAVKWLLLSKGSLGDQFLTVPRSVLSMLACSPVMIRLHIIASEVNGLKYFIFCQL
jgi:hypothetical protein